MSALEGPDSPDDLYRYRGDDVPRARPIFQGDVFENVEIPGLEDGPKLALVMTHPCSMRDGPTLRNRLQLGRVSESIDTVDWRGNYGIVPLPHLRPDADIRSFKMRLEDVGIVNGELLEPRSRIACLSDLGISLLQQRQAHYYTRDVVEKEVLFENSASLLVEAELLEEWIGSLVDDNDPDWTAKSQSESIEFDIFFGPLRDAAKSPLRRVAIRRQVRDEIVRRSDAGS